jgi:hypothetical protein
MMLRRMNSDPMGMFSDLHADSLSPILTSPAALSPSHHRMRQKERGISLHEDTEGEGEGEQDRGSHTIEGNLPLDQNQPHMSISGHGTHDDPNPSHSLSAYEIMSMIEEEREKEEREKVEMTRRLKLEQMQRIGTRVVQIEPGPPDRLLAAEALRQSLSLPLRGVVTSLKSSLTAERLTLLGELERQKGENRLILPALRSYKTDKYSEFVKEFPGLEEDPKPFVALDDEDRRNYERKMRQKLKDVPIGPVPSPTASRGASRGGGGREKDRERDKERGVKGPMAIKTQTKYESRDGLTGLPVSPFKSYEEGCRVMNAGVPAGAGMMLWRPKETITETGRYRVGNHSKNNKKWNEVSEGKVRPFVSAA